MFVRAIFLYLFLVTHVGLDAACSLESGASYSVPAGSSGPLSVAFSPSGNFLVTANFSADVPEFAIGAGGTLSSGTSYLTLLPAFPHSGAFSPSGAYLATANANSADVTLFSINSSGVLNAETSYSLPSGSIAPWSIAFSPSGQYLVTANLQSKDVTVFTVGVNGALSNLPPIHCLRVRPDLNHLRFPQMVNT